MIKEKHTYDSEGACICGARSYSAGLVITNGTLTGIGTCTDTVLVLPGTVKKIAAGALKNCTQLTAVILPSSVTYIGAGAFSGCTSLVSVEIRSTEKWTAGSAAADITDAAKNAAAFTTGAWVDQIVRVKGSGTETPIHVFQ